MLLMVLGMCACGESGGKEEKPALRVGIGRVDMRARNNKDVNGCLRGNIAEGEHRLVLVNACRGDLPAYDLAENTVHLKPPSV